MVIGNATLDTLTTQTKAYMRFRMDLDLRNSLESLGAIE